MSTACLKKTFIYIYDLPYTERKEFCNIIDMNDKWEELGKYVYLYVCADIYTHIFIYIYYNW